MRKAKLKDFVKVFITKEQKTWLAKRADENDCSQSEILRTLLAEKINKK